MYLKHFAFFLTHTFFVFLCTSCLLSFFPPLSVSHLVCYLCTLYFSCICLCIKFYFKKKKKSLPIVFSSALCFSLFSIYSLNVFVVFLFFLLYLFLHYVFHPFQFTLLIYLLFFICIFFDSLHLCLQLSCIVHYISVSCILFVCILPIILFKICFSLLLLIVFAASYYLRFLILSLALIFFVHLSINLFEFCLYIYCVYLCDLYSYICVLSPFWSLFLHLISSIISPLSPVWHLFALLQDLCTFFYLYVFDLRGQGDILNFHLFS